MIPFYLVHLFLFSFGLICLINGIFILNILFQTSGDVIEQKYKIILSSIILLVIMITTHNMLEMIREFYK